MNIVLVNLGELPSYFGTCVRQIRKYFDGSIYVCAEVSPGLVSALGLTRVTSGYENGPRSSEYSRASFMKSKYGDFWDHTFKRLFILEDIINHYGLNDVIHIENDVLIYSNPNNINFPNYNCVAVNPVGPKYATYAYCLIRRPHMLTELNTKNLERLALGHDHLLHSYGEGMVNEMLIAGDLLNSGATDILPTLPGGEHPQASSHFDTCQSLFDGSAWGQYVGGIPANPTAGWMEPKRWVGEALLANKYSISWHQREPYVVSQSQMIKLNNLHIHSKQLDKYV